MKFADTRVNAVPTYCVSTDTLLEVSETFDQTVKDWIQKNQFLGSIGQSVCCPTQEGEMIALLGMGNKNSRKRSRFSLAAAAKSLPAGSYEILNSEAVENFEIEALGWLMNSYIFDKYKNKKESIEYKKWFFKYSPILKNKLKSKT